MKEITGHTTLQLRKDHWNVYQSKFILVARDNRKFREYNKMCSVPKLELEPKNQQPKTEHGKPE